MNVKKGIVILEMDNAVELDVIDDIMKQFFKTFGNELSLCDIGRLMWALYRGDTEVPSVGGVDVNIEYTFIDKDK